MTCYIKKKQVNVNINLENDKKRKKLSDSAIETKNKAESNFKNEKESQVDEDHYNFKVGFDEKKIEMELNVDKDEPPEDSYNIFQNNKKRKLNGVEDSKINENSSNNNNILKISNIQIEQQEENDYDNE